MSGRLSQRDRGGSEYIFKSTRADFLPVALDVDQPQPTSVAAHCDDSISIQPQCRLAGARVLIRQKLRAQDAQLMAGECDIGCPGCWVLEGIPIASGASIVRMWPGSIFTDASLPADCFGAGDFCDEAEPDCMYSISAPARSYTLGSVA